MLDICFFPNENIERHRKRISCSPGNLTLQEFQTLIKKPHVFVTPSWPSLSRGAAQKSQVRKHTWDNSTNDSAT